MDIKHHIIGKFLSKPSLNFDCRTSTVEIEWDSPIENVVENLRELPNEELGCLITKGESVSELPSMDKLYNGHATTAIHDSLWNPIIDRLWKGKEFKTLYCDGEEDPKTVVINHLAGDLASFIGIVTISKLEDVKLIPHEAILHLDEDDPGQYVMIDYRLTTEADRKCVTSIKGPSKWRLTDSALKIISTGWPFNSIFDIFKRVYRNKDSGKEIFLGRAFSALPFQKEFGTVAYFLLENGYSE